MAKYVVTREDYQGGIIGYAGKKKTRFEALNDTDAMLKVVKKYGWSYADENDVEYGDPGFIVPSVEEAKEALIDSNNMGGSGYIYQIENLDTGKVIFEDPDIEEDEMDEGMSAEEAFHALNSKTSKNESFNDIAKWEADVEEYGYSIDWEETIMNPVLDELGLESDGNETGYTLIDAAGNMCSIDYENDNLVRLSEEGLKDLINSRMSSSDNI